MSQNSQSRNDQSRDRQLDGRAYRVAKHSVLEKERQKENKYRHRVITEDDAEDDFDMFAYLDDEKDD
jgi:hypothetical protein